MAQDKITAKQQEILEYIKEHHFKQGLSAGCPGDLRGSPLKVHLFRSLPSVRPGGKGLYPTGSHQAQDH